MRVVLLVALGQTYNIVVNAQPRGVEPRMRQDILRLPVEFVRGVVFGGVNLLGVDIPALRRGCNAVTVVGEGQRTEHEVCAEQV